MKHWIEFLEKRTHEAKRLGKRVNALDFEVLEARQNLEMYEKQRNEVEAQIYNLIEPLYIDNTECTKAILQAKSQWQTTLLHPKRKNVIAAMITV